MEQQPYSQFSQYSRPLPPEPSAPVMTVGKWLVTYLLLMIPIANIILMIVWAVSDNENPNRKNWAIAMLILWAASLVLVAFMWGAIMAAMGGMVNKFS